jgi:hypothetical protein
MSNSWSFIWEIMATEERGKPIDALCRKLVVYVCVCVCARYIPNSSQRSFLVPIRGNYHVVLHSSLLSFSSSHFGRPWFYFSSAHCSLLALLFPVNSLQSSFPSLRLALALYPLNHLCSDKPYGETSGRVSLTRHERGARGGT